MENTDLQPNAIFTIGHGNKGIVEFIAILKHYEINLLVDVRSVPYSRYHPQFRQINLKNSLNGAGLDYLWLGEELGGWPSDPNLYCNGKVDYEAVKETLLFMDGIQQVIRLAAENIKITLTCSESDQNECHRKHLISDELERRGINVVHINKIGIIEQHISTFSSNLFE